MQRFEQIYAEYRDTVRAYVRRRAPEELVDDVVADVFVVCLRRIDDVPRQPLPWLYGVARKTLANERRRRAQITPVEAAVAFDPVPTRRPVRDPSQLSWRPRRAAFAVALAAAIAVPAVAFAGRLGDLFGISSQGIPEPASSLYLSQDSTMNQAMAGLGFPSTLQELGTVNGVTFFASRRADGHYCFALEKDGNRGGISCDLGGAFPSPTIPVWVFPPYDGFSGYAADGVATVNGLDASGDVVVSAPVANNLFAAPTGDYTDVATVEAFDAHGKQIWSWHLPRR